MSLHLCGTDCKIKDHMEKRIGEDGEVGPFACLGALEIRESGVFHKR